MNPTIPPVVIDRVTRALKSIQSVSDRLNDYHGLDSRLGSQGRYEWEAWDAMRSELVDAQRVIDVFRTMAPKNGVDAEAALQELGGLAAPEPSSRALQYGAECGPKKAPITTVCSEPRHWRAHRKL